MATTLGLVGSEVPVWSQGRDFSPLLRGEDFNPPADVLLEMCGSPRWNLGMSDSRGVVGEHWKNAFIENRMELLFDLDNDPFRQHNLARENPEESARQRLLELLRETRDPDSDVLIEHAITCDDPVADVSPHPARHLPYLHE